ncbi:hypothetical protein GCM10007897_15330 [Sphingobium jiangsuense]|uniref:Uncharacterized protein n=1 Tax=Sphingobium jiangsuense TaxID=870476 RepID=A0A7W6BDS9_9SPHN|nr:hypothetical protein [Sphingobium jiangsuense]GLT00149.1 hypothetical protein GCM10007897_15330 [Sphingobium jiangsuense]
MEQIDEIRASVADELERRGLSNRQFIREIREGKRDDGPFMTGALAWHRRQARVR